MKTVEAIENRRSIRSFKSDDLTKEVVEDILNCGRLAPSAKNRQPWYFVIVKNETKNKIADMMIAYTMNYDDRADRKKFGCENTFHPTAKIIKEAPVLVFVFKEKDENWTIGDNLSIGACVENMCLRATELGIGSLWIRDTVCVAEVADMLGHGDMELNCAVALGMPNQNPAPRPRKELNDIVEWYGE